MAIKNYIYIHSSRVEGDFVNGAELPIDPHNNMLMYNDGTYEDMLAYGTEVRHLPAHLTLLNNNLKRLNIKPPLLLYNPTSISENITRLLNKNRIFDSSHIRLSVYRSANDSACLSIQSRPLPYRQYCYNESGIVLSVLENSPHPDAPLSLIRGANGTLNALARQYAKSQRADNCLMLNRFGRIADAIEANMFIMHKNTLYTPSKREGCCPNVMRDLVLQAAMRLGIAVQHQVGLSLQAVLDADELFLAEPLCGITWAIACLKQRYRHNTSQLIHNEISRLTFGG